MHSLQFRPYYDDAVPSEVQKKLYTEIHILFAEAFARPKSNFNPTLSAGGDTIPYDFPSYLKRGLLSPTQQAEFKYKFIFYNSSLTISNFYFLEGTTPNPSGASLFFMRRAPFKWLRSINNMYAI